MAPGGGLRVEGEDESRVSPAIMLLCMDCEV